MPTYRLPDEDPPTDVLVPILYRNCRQGITLQIDHNKGAYNVASLTADGRLELHSNIPTGLGLKVDQDGRIRTVNG